mgnify:CR=1 FL=1
MAKYTNEGVYEAEVIDHAFTETKNGNPMIEMECKIHSKILGFGSGSEERVPPESSQYNVNVRIVFATENQRAFNLARLRYAGWTGKSFEDFDMVGQMILIVNQHANGEGKNAGKVYDNFELVSPPREHKELESKPGVKRKLNALLSKELRETASAAPAGRPAATQKNSDPVPDRSDAPAAGDDETPF